MTTILYQGFTHTGAMLRKSAWALPLCMAAFAGAPAGAAALDCAALSSTPIYQVINPTRQTSLLTRWQNEADNAVQYGFTINKGALFRAAVAPADGLVAAHRLYKPSNGDFVWMINPSEIASAIQSYGYVDQGINFYVSPTPASCAQPVYRFYKNGIFRNAVSQADRDALTASGWTTGNPTFYAAADPNAGANDSSVFTIAIMPDTQEEAQPAAMSPSPTCTPINGYHNTKDDRFSNRAQWLVDYRDDLTKQPLRYVLHSGDVVNWGERDEYQYSNVVSPGMQKLENAGIPYVLSLGNHDTRAVGGGGGGACNGYPTVTKDLRQSPLFNKYFAGRFGDSVGSYQPYRHPNDVNPTNPAGNISNGFTTFEAGGLKWLVLSLEFLPRQKVVEWAQNVVGSHPNHNVIVVTHSYLHDSSGNLLSKEGADQYAGPDATDPQDLRDNLITKYKNIRFVFSGHAGGPDGIYKYTGNPAVAYLQSFHDKATNPVRILRIDTANNTATSYIYAPKTNQYWNGGGWSNTAVQDVKTGMNYIH